MESQKILCDVCGASFTKNKNLLRHVREVHQGMKRTDNETRKRDVTDKVRKQGHLACTDIRTCEVPVESVTHAWKDVTDKARKQGLLAGLYSETFEAQVESVSHAWKDVTDKARKQGLLACGSWAACVESVESVPQAVFKRPAEYVATVIITFTVLHSQFWIHSDYSDYSDYYSDCLH